MLGFKSPISAQRFVTTHAAIYNAFDFQRHMISRATAPVVPGKGGLCPGESSRMSRILHVAEEAA